MWNCYVRNASALINTNILQTSFTICTTKHTFFIWNLMVALISSTLSLSFSEWVHMVGNLPALLRPGPTRRGICLIRASEAMKASYFLAVECKTCINPFVLRMQQIWKKKVNFRVSWEISSTCLGRSLHHASRMAGTRWPRVYWCMIGGAIGQPPSNMEGL